MSEITAKQLALMLYKLSVENNAMLRACMNHNEQTLKFLRMMQMDVRARYTTKSAQATWDEVERGMDQDVKEREKMLVNILAALEDIARQQAKIWADMAPDDLSAVHNHYTHLAS